MTQKMGKAMRDLLQNGHSYDEPDRMPDKITIKNLDIILYVFAILTHVVDLGLDLNVALRYFFLNKIVEFGWTLAFILVPAFVNTAVSIRMYSLDKQQDSLTNKITKRHWLRIFILVLQMAPILRFTDALIYAIKSRRADRAGDPASQRRYYQLMLKEDADAALLRVFECFMEAAPQQVLQTCFLMHNTSEMTIHQLLSICSSIVSMGWCLASYQRCVRYTQQDKNNITWPGTVLLTLWHYMVSLSRITSISIIAYLYPHWTIVACCLHILIMTTLLQIFDRSPFCSQNRIADIAFSLTLGVVYLFTYILPVEGPTRYRYTMYYSVCFLENIVCCMLWYFYVNDDMRDTIYFLPILVLSVVPYVLGLCIMGVYYGFFHPNVNKNVSDINMSVTYKVNDSSVS